MIRAETLRRQTRVKELCEKLRSCKNPEERKLIENELLIEKQNRLKTTSELDSLVFKLKNVSK